MKGKRIIAALLSLCIMAGAGGYAPTMPDTTLTAFAEETVSEGGFEFVLYDDHAEVISCSSMFALYVTLPDEVDGLPLTRIGENAFAGHNEMGGIVIPDTVTSIGAGAFSSCAELTQIDIPASVTAIDGSAFWGTKWLDEQREAVTFVMVNGILLDAHTEAESGSRLSA